MVGKDFDNEDDLDGEESQGAESLEPELNIDDVEITEEQERTDNESYGGQSLAEAEETAQNDSDIKTIAKYLHQQYKDPVFNEIMQSAASSRIFADNMKDKNYGIVMSRIMQHEPDEAFDVMALISAVQDGCSRGFEGRQRIEDLELAGVAREEEMEELTKKLGL
jgi:hypothetical protein